MMVICNKSYLSRALFRPTSLAVAVFLTCSSAAAFEMNTGNPDFTMRWDNTVKYSSAFRLKDQSSALLSDLNQDDGNRNFDKGLISNRFDLFSEFDISYKYKYGARISGAAWYDTVYNKSNDNDNPDSFNGVGRTHKKFASDTRDLHGRDAEILDAFIYANFHFGDLPTTIRLGKHSLLYGETLFFGANGIAHAQSPIDVVKALSVPNSQFKEIILPVNQISGQIQLMDNLAFGAYYQLEFRESRLPGAGSYFSNVDVLDEGGDVFLFAPGVGASRVSDKDARDSGQFGFQLRWRPDAMDTEFGLYAVRYHDKLSQQYLRPLGLPPPMGSGAAFPLNYQLVYPEDIKSYGISFSTAIGEANISGEMSVRRDTPLVTPPTVDASLNGSAGTGSSAIYAVGNSAHANLSMVYLMKPGKFWQGGSFLGEIAWNRMTSITKNPQALAANASRDAYGFRFIFEPQWFQVVPQLDVSMPIGVGYNPQGNSAVVQGFNGGTKTGGDISIGLKGVYEQKWHVGMNYTHYFGSEGNNLDETGTFSFRQSMADRDFVSITVQTTF